MAANQQAPEAKRRNRGKDPLIGEIVAGRYKILAPLDRGGMGKIYRAEQLPIQRIVALKILDVMNHDDDQDDTYSKRFMLEASVLASLSHPNTVTVHDYGRTEDNKYYMAMELLTGVTLRGAIRQVGSLSPRRTTEIAKQVCASLREAHGMGVIHRDIKPANIFLSLRDKQEEWVKVLDFGLVKRVDEDSSQLTQTGTFLGSPKYMAPEQIGSSNVDGRADLYALGVVMFEMLAGRPPFERDTPAAILVAQMREVAPLIHEINPKVNIPPELENIVQRCLAKEPDQRYADVGELLETLSALDFNAGASSTISLVEQTREGRPRPEQSNSKTSSQTFSHTFTQGKPAHRVSAVAIIIAAVAAAGLMSYLDPFGGTPDAQTTAPTPPESAAPLAAQAPPDELEHIAIPEGKLVVTLRCKPEGTMVRISEKEYGPTPTHIVLSGENATLGHKLVIEFHKSGYLSKIITRRVDAQKLMVDAGQLLRDQSD